MLLERSEGECRQGDHPRPIVLGGLERQPLACFGEAPADGDGSGFEVYVLPPEREDLSAACAGGQRQKDGDVGACPLAGLEDLKRLVPVERPLLVSSHPGWGYGIGRIDGEHLTAVPSAWWRMLCMLRTV